MNKTFLSGLGISEYSKYPCNGVGNVSFDLLPELPDHQSINKE